MNFKIIKIGVIGSIKKTPTKQNRVCKTRAQQSISNLFLKTTRNVYSSAYKRGELKQWRQAQTTILIVMQPLKSFAIRDQLF